MKKRIIIASILFIVAGAAFIYYFMHRVPDDIEVKGSDRISGIVSLATAVVSLATAVITLMSTRRRVESG